MKSILLCALAFLVTAATGSTQTQLAAQAPGWRFVPAAKKPSGDGNCIFKGQTVGNGEIKRYCSNQQATWCAGYACVTCNDGKLSAPTAC